MSGMTRQQRANLVRKAPKGRKPCKNGLVRYGGVGRCRKVDKNGNPVETGMPCGKSHMVRNKYDQCVDPDAQWRLRKDCQSQGKVLGKNGKCRASRRGKGRKKCATKTSKKASCPTVNYSGGVVRLVSKSGKFAYEIHPVNGGYERRYGMVGSKLRVAQCEMPPAQHIAERLANGYVVVTGSVKAAKACATTCPKPKSRPASGGCSDKVILYKKASNGVAYQWALTRHGNNLVVQHGRVGSPLKNEQINEPACNFDKLVKAKRAKGYSAKVLRKSSQSKSKSRSCSKPRAKSKSKSRGKSKSKSRGKSKSKSRGKSKSKCKSNSCSKPRAKSASDTTTLYRKSNGKLHFWKIRQQNGKIQTAHGIDGSTAKWKVSQRPCADKAAMIKEKLARRHKKRNPSGGYKKTKC